MKVIISLHVDIQGTRLSFEMCTIYSTDITDDFAIFELLRMKTES